VIFEQNTLPLVLTFVMFDWSVAWLGADASITWHRIVGSGGRGRLIGRIG